MVLHEVVLLLPVAYGKVILYLHTSSYYAQRFSPDYASKLKIRDPSLV